MRRSDWIAAAAAAVVTPLLLIGRMPTAGADLAHHYKLARVLLDEGMVSAEAARLGGMYVYPPLAHYVAAAVGALSGTGFTAMTTVAAGAVAIIYATILALVRSVSIAASVIAFIAIAIMMAARVRLVPGAEVVGNFFYAQLVAYALCLIALAAFAASYRRREGMLLDLAVLAAAHVVAFAHLLPALQLLGTYGLLLLVEAAGERTRSIAIRLVVFAVFSLTLFLNPSFAKMIMLSAHEGGITYGFRITPFSRVLVFLGALLLSGAAMVAFRREKGAGLFLGAFGSGAALLGLAQWLAFELAGHGSSYAVSKHMGSAGTFAVVNGCCLLGVALEKRYGKPMVRGGEWGAFLSLAASAIILSLALLAPRWSDNADFLAFQSFVRSNPPPALPAIAYSSKLPTGQNYLISIGDLGLSRIDMLEAIRQAEPLPPGEYIVFLQDGDEKALPGCRESLVRQGEFRMVRCVFS